MKRFLLLLIAFCPMALAFYAHSAIDSQADSIAERGPEGYVPRPWTLDIFMGVDFNYRDIWLNDNRVFDLLINLTPAVKWRLPHRWEIEAQVLVPVLNQYGRYYRNVRLNMAGVSKQLAIGSRWKTKVTVGLFTLERYGIDWKNMVIANPWLAFTGEFGWTGHCFLGHGWDVSKMKRISALVGPEFYLRNWDTQFSVKGGRYVYGDWGVEAEAMRHFRHVTFSVYGLYSSEWGKNAGFKVNVMLPPYKRHRRTVNFRPASNFRLTYSGQAESSGNLNYRTDPEENERTGWFDRDLLPWGIDLKKPDFIVAEPKSKKDKKTDNTADGDHGKEVDR